jgi:arginyl-tRNA synthetase
MTDSARAPTSTLASSVDPIEILDERFRAAIAAVLGVEAAAADPQIRPSSDPRHGDFQSNAAMALAKAHGVKPRELAERIAAAAALSGIAGPCEIAGPGFINIRLDPAALAALLGRMDDAALGIARQERPHAVTVDLCGVNVAKQMHVGHLRATIIGDCLARVFERLGRRVHRENHLGDWGLPIAMTLASLRRSGADLGRISLADLNAAYRAAQAEGAGDEGGLAAARSSGAGPHRLAELEEHNAGAHAAVEEAKSTLLRLQAEEIGVVRDWKRIIECTMQEVFETAVVLGVVLGPEHSRGESFYRDRLAEVVTDFLEAGLASEDAGAIVVRFPDRERPLLIRKSDGGFLYATTDLAAVRFRVQELESDRVVYVVDARQRDHFKDVFDACRMIGWDRTSDGTRAELVHLGFGAVLGADKRPLKTRSGENATLASLLAEAVARGEREVRARAADPEGATHGLEGSELHAIGRAVGIAAVKYADLSLDVSRDYVFDLDRMVSFAGDTGPYIQYAHARIRSILEKGGVAIPADGPALPAAAIAIAEPAERELALALLAYPSTVAETARTLEPSRLCAYLQRLAAAFTGFYQACPVLRSEEPLRSSRLRLCDLSRRVLADGLGLLGIETPRRM